MSRVEDEQLAFQESAIPAVAVKTKSASPACHKKWMILTFVFPPPRLPKERPEP